MTAIIFGSMKKKKNPLKENVFVVRVNNITMNIMGNGKVHGKY
jgi:hypothetical protein